MHLLLFYFGIPYGAVYSNIFAQPICAALALSVVYLLRNKIAPKAIAFVHRHHAAHLAQLERENDS